ncbi:hypothetical protein OUZ56_016213 [Daphnia magna]|uniref:Uncharacterized protein n=1 Tax=Daphnia magna TaxID=35525 RepID=A0ABR0AQ06_9CRUS|nr:hypothetical protein OUZ56_016213 [Daphnia magna]
MSDTADSGLTPECQRLAPKCQRVYISVYWPTCHLIGRQYHEEVAVKDGKDGVFYTSGRLELSARPRIPQVTRSSGTDGAGIAANSGNELASSDGGNE